MDLGSRFAGVSCVVLAACVSPSQPDSPTRTPLAGDSALVAAFTTAGARTGVPAELLATLAYDATRLRVVHATGHASSRPSESEGVARAGLFALPLADLERGAALAGVTTAAAIDDATASAMAAGALLHAQAPRAHTVAEFLAALAPEQRTELAATLARGIDARDEAGGRVVVAAQPALALASHGLGTAVQALVGYTGAEWVPASTTNYKVAARTTSDVDHIVIHTTEGVYSGTLSWFKDPAAKVSAHYVVRSRDGHIAQMVDEKNVAWHDACFNTRTIGIEHEAFMAHPEVWFTEAMYTESAALTANIAERYGIAKEHGPILGHGEAPDCSDHEDPGPDWDWEHYIDLVRTGGAPKLDADSAAVDVPASLMAGEHAVVTVTLANRGNTTWSVDTTRLGTAEPQDRDSELFVDGEWIAPNRPAGVDEQVAPNGWGVFSFEIVAPDVSEPTDFDETFQLVEGDSTWFGPEVHVATRVMPAITDASSEPGGCSATDSGSSGGACAILALGALVVRRRSRSRR